MKFNSPPQWPAAPEGWFPEPGWTPDNSWPQPSKDWAFWVNDYGVPVDGPAGLYGAKSKSRTGRVVAVGLSIAAFVLGFAIAPGGGETPPDAAPAASTVTVTATTTATPATVTPAAVTVTEVAETVTQEAEAETVTEEVEVTVTETAIEYVEAQGGSDGGIAGFYGGGGGGGGAADPAPPADVYYKNCDAVRAAGAAPIYLGQPGYRGGLDRDGDGVGCE